MGSGRVRPVGEPPNRRCCSRAMTSSMAMSKGQSLSISRRNLPDSIKPHHCLPRRYRWIESHSSSQRPVLPRRFGLARRLRWRGRVLRDIRIPDHGTASQEVLIRKSNPAFFLGGTGATIDAGPCCPVLYNGSAVGLPGASARCCIGWPGSGCQWPFRRELSVLEKNPLFRNGRRHPKFSSLLVACGGRAVLLCLSSVPNGSGGQTPGA